MTDRSANRNLGRGLCRRRRRGAAKFPRLKSHLSIFLVISWPIFSAKAHYISLIQDPISSKEMKRLDIQAIRGVAILLVLIFHLHPATFSLGFIGVDIFFVLSGYLMAVILSREMLTRNSLEKFYSRRFRRIVPLYYIILTVVYAGTNFLLIHPDKKQLLLDIKWVLPFAGNFEPLFEATGYWDQVNSTRFFVHCWSLAVEIQFYLIAPFIIFGGQQFSAKMRKLPTAGIEPASPRPQRGVLTTILRGPRAVALGSIEDSRLIDKAWQNCFGTYYGQICVFEAEIEITDGLGSGQKTS